MKQVTRSLSILSLLALAACSSSSQGTGPNAGEAARQIASAFCGKLNSCSPSDFAAAFPGGVQACVQAGVNGVKNKDAPSTCTQGQLDTCVNDTSNMTCPASLSGANTAPSCGGC